MSFELSDLGYKIFYDRYALKDTHKDFYPGDQVLVITDKDSGQRELGYVVHNNNHVSANPADWNRYAVKIGDEIKDYHKDLVEKPIETPTEAAWRVANAVASVESSDSNTPFASDFRSEQERWANKFFGIMNDWKFIPAGRIWAAAGNPAPLTYFNCYVLPSPKDSRSGIVDTLKQMIEIMSRGGGVGINLSTLRPKKAIVRGVNGHSSGAVSWGGMYSYGTGLIEQGGSRRGALMLILDDWHPDILDFIDSKREAGKITNANISVGISDEFMEAVKNDESWDLIFPDTSSKHYDLEWDGDIKKWAENSLLREHYGIKIYKTVSARLLWRKIIESAWASAEPGIWFRGKSNRASNSWYYDELICTNPCGEMPLPAWGVCNLGSINLAKFVDKGEVDWQGLQDTIKIAVRFLDDAIDATPYFYDENEAQQKKERRIGLNTMGLAEMLIKLQLRYGSDESVDFINRLYELIARTAYIASWEIAQEKGSFPAFDHMKYLDSGYMKSMPEIVRGLISNGGIRNAVLLTQAPNGTTGTMVGTSTGIEPFFSFKWLRKSRLGVHEENMEIAQDWLQYHPGEPLPPYFTTAMQLSPEEHVKVQAAIQRWVDSAISKTVNCPGEYTTEQVAKVYELMYDLGCKGGTIYRDKSRSEQILMIPQGEECPECHKATLVNESGCETCSNCGYSLCKL